MMTRLHPFAVEARNRSQSLLFSDSIRATTTGVSGTRSWYVDRSDPNAIVTTLATTSALLPR